MRYLILVFVVLFLLNSCKKDEQEDQAIPSTGKRCYIANEGAFGFSNASLSLYYPDSNVMINNAFQKVNGRNPGDVLQSICVSGDEIYLIVNSSNKIEIAQESSLEEIKTLGNIPLPRYMCTQAGLGFISCWGNGGEIQVLDLSSKSIVGHIPVGLGPEKMLVSEDILVVANSGGYSTDSLLHFIHTGTQDVMDSLIVGDNPIDIVDAGNGKVWVLCRGKVVYDGSGQIVEESQAKLVKVNVQQASIEMENILGSGHPSHLEVSPDGKTLYIGGGFGFNGIYTFDVATQTHSTQPLISLSAYGFNVNPHDGNIYVLEAPSFTVAGKLKIFNSKGVLLKDHNVGVGPNEVVF